MGWSGVDTRKWGSKLDRRPGQARLPMYHISPSLTVVPLLTLLRVDIFSNCLPFFSFPGLQLVWVQN